MSQKFVKLLTSSEYKKFVAETESLLDAYHEAVVSEYQRLLLQSGALVKESNSTTQESHLPKHDPAHGDAYEANRNAWHVKGRMELQSGSLDSIHRALKVAKERLDHHTAELDQALGRGDKEAAKHHAKKAAAFKGAHDGLAQALKNESASGPDGANVDDLLTQAQVAGVEQVTEELLTEAPTRKHFQAVADTLKHIEDPAKRKELALHHADIFKKQNPRFDRSRFLQAAGVEDHAEGLSPDEKFGIRRYNPKLFH